MNFLCMIGLHKWKYGEYKNNGWLKCIRCDILKNCKYCGASNLYRFAGIGSDGIFCKLCGRIQ